MKNKNVDNIDTFLIPFSTLSVYKHIKTWVTVREYTCERPA